MQPKRTTAHRQRRTVHRPTLRVQAARSPGPVGASSSTVGTSSPPRCLETLGALRLTGRNAAGKPPCHPEPSPRALVPSASEPAVVAQTTPSSLHRLVVMLRLTVPIPGPPKLPRRPRPRSPSITRGPTSSPAAILVHRLDTSDTVGSRSPQGRKLRQTRRARPTTRETALPQALAPVTVPMSMARRAGARLHLARHRPALAPSVPYEGPESRPARKCLCKRTTRSAAPLRQIMADRPVTTLRLRTPQGTHPPLRITTHRGREPTAVPARQLRPTPADRRVAPGVLIPDDSARPQLTSARVKPRRRRSGLQGRRTTKCSAGRAPSMSVT